MICCDYATLQHGGAPILVGIFRGINAESFPGRIAPFWLAMEIEADPHEAGDHEFMLRFVDDDGQILFSDTLVGQFHRRPDFQPSFIYNAAVVEITKPIERPGSYRFDLVWRSEVLYQLRIQIS